LTARFCDELPFAFGWIAPEPRFMQRASHALGDGGRVWLVDPVDVEGLDERVRALGEPAGVIQLLDRHGRDGAALAARYGVPLHAAPASAVPGSSFELISVVDLPGWRESGLWWPERRLLVVADALGTAAYFLGPGERLAVHPLLRLLPPRALLPLEPEHVVCGHGEGVHGADTAAALRHALRTSRRGIPRWAAGLARNLVRR
jgi:glyoxylase-like metal-dependent hydrolase (beta-lactamase superfamily II)